ncbi:hypothetical protein V5799_014197, partial [Amblyomma americanum]
MGSQQFCLKWNNHQSNMLAVFYEMLSNEALVDVTLACEGLSLKAHKMVLSACSPFFQALFAENPCKHPIVILKDMRYTDLRAIVEFMYRGEVDVSQDDLMALFKTAETLKVKGIVEDTNENKNGGLVTSVDGAADAGPVDSPRAESPPLSKRKKSRRPRRRSPSDFNKSDSEDAPPATRIKVSDSPEIIEDVSMSSDRVTDLPAASPSSRASNVASSTAVPSGDRHGSSVQASISQHTQDSIGDDVGEGDDADFDVEPLDVVEESATTENVPVFPDVASSSQALGDESQLSAHTGSTSDNSALVPAQPSLPSDISIMSQVDIKPSPNSLTPYDDKTIAPVVAASPAAASSGDGASTSMAATDASGVPAIAGPSGYQQSTPSHAAHPLRTTMGSQQFCLKWNNHQSNMLAVFYEMLSNEALVDVTLACEGLSLKAHKMVLSACSPFFQALFAENPCKHPIVILKDMRYTDLRAIVEFMYRGEVDVSQDDLMALFKTAETLKVKGIVEDTNENKNGGLVASVEGAADAGPVGSLRAESPPLSKRKKSRRPRRRSPSDSNKSDSEDAPPATRIKVPDSPEIIEDGSMSSDHMTNPPAASPSSRASNVASSTAVPSGAPHGSSVQASISQHTQDSIADNAGEGDDADFDVEPLDVVEESATTENVPVFPDVGSSSQAVGDESQLSAYTGSTSDNSALLPAQPSLPSDISIMSQVDIKPSPNSLTPYDDKTIAPVVAASPAAAPSGDSASTAMAATDASGVPAIAGPSGYQQSTPSH